MPILNPADRGREEAERRTLPIPIMKTAPYALFRYLVPGLAWVAVSAAQSTPPASEAEDVVQLSPFVIDAAEEEGYGGSSTLSGSRLKSNLEDVAASVTVLTNDFLDDLGATDLASALAYVTGAENDATSDPQGGDVLNQGFVGSDFGDLSGRSGEVRVRGLGRASTAADYIQLIGPTDRYNIDRSEFLRGANSILFGLAEPAGLLNLSTKRANTRREINRVDLRVDSFGSVRGQLDFNRALIKGKLAIRAVVLKSDTKYDVETAFERDDRQFFTATYNPFENTTLRASYENIDINARRPNYRTMQDNVSAWLALYNEAAAQLSPAQLAAAFYWDASKPGGANGIPPSSVITVGGQTIDLGVLRRTLDGRAQPVALVYDSSDWTTPLFGGATEFARVTTNGGLASPANTRAYFVRSADPFENTSGYFDHQVTDPKIFPFQDQELAALPGNYRWERANRFNLSLDQRIGEDLFLSASFQTQEFKSEQLFSPIAQQQQISIDVNTYLPDGRQNPNFLRPFVYGRSIGGFTDSKTEDILVQGNYDFDFAKKTERLKWLGLHRLTALYTKSSLDTQGYRWNIQADNTIPGVYDPTFGNAGRHLYQFWYIGDPVQVGDTSLRLTGLPTTTVSHPDQSFNLTYYDNASRTWKQSPEPIHASRQLIANGRSYSELENDGFGVSMQSFFWHKRVVSLLGWRTDGVESFTNTLNDINATPYQGETRADYVRSGIPDFKDRTSTSTQSVVFKVTDWLRVFASRSENFAATAPRTDNLFRPIAPQNGETKEFGFGLSMLDRKLSFRATVYDSSQNLATSSGAATTAALRVDAFEDTLYNALEAAGRLSEWRTIGAQGESTLPYDEPLNVSATANSKSKGWEAELTYNPTSSWRVSFSLSQLDNKLTNIGQELRAFIDARADYYRPFFQEGLRTDGTNSTNPSTSTLLSESFRNTVASNYISNIVTEGTSNVGVPEYLATLVANYKFREGFLKGFSVGGNLRWESSKIFGYQQIDTVYNLGGLENEPGKVADITHPWMSDPVITGGLMFNYARKIFDDRVNWKVQLNAQNLFSEHGLRIIRVNPDNSPVWGIARPLTFTLSNTFDF